MAKKQTIGLFIGRFQPLHNAHLRDIKEALREVDFLYIGIGSANEKRTEKNPFSARERKKMIDAALKEEGISAYELVEIPDFHDDGKWAAHIQKIMPKPDVVFMGNAQAREFFEKRGYKTKLLPFIEGVSATQVRNMIADGIKWEQIVPKPVSAYIAKNRLIEKIRT